MARKEQLLSDIDSAFLAEAAALEWALQVSSGMALLHNRGLIHRDIKPGNILLNEANKALIADLGTVRHAGSEHPPMSEEQQEANLEAMCATMDEEYGSDAVSVSLHQQTRGKTHMTGTPMFMAPEQFTTKYSYPVDVWEFGMTVSLGMVIVVLLVVFPFTDIFPGHYSLLLCTADSIVHIETTNSVARRDPFHGNDHWHPGQRICAD